MLLDGVEYTFSIGNIYLEEDNFDYGLKVAMGDYVVSQDMFSSMFERQALYFLTTYDTSNEKIINHLLETYSVEGYSFSFNDRNVVSVNVDATKLTDFFYHRDEPRSKADVIVMILILVAALLAIVSLVLCYIWKLYDPINILIMIPFAVTPYVAFEIIYAVTANMYLHSNIGVIAETAILIIYLILFVTISFWRPRRRHNSS